MDGCGTEVEECNVTAGGTDSVTMMFVMTLTVENSFTGVLVVVETTGGAGLVVVETIGGVEEDVVVGSVVGLVVSGQ